MEEDYVLKLSEISKSFPGVKVLDKVQFNLKPGEVHGLMGENGAGKSTLMKILMGIYSPDSGSITLDGHRVRISNPQDALNLGISMIHQELNPVKDMKIYENIFLGRELKNKLGLADNSRMLNETKIILEKIGIKKNPATVMKDLSVAECQQIEIAKAISTEAKIVIMDEPTSAITEDDVATLFAQINNLKANGVSVIYISHKMAEIYSICDRITVLRDGIHVRTDDAANISENDLIKLMVGREINDIFPKIKTEPGDLLLSVNSLSLTPKVKNISLELKQGEILGIGGLVGSGRSEFVETLFGYRKKDGGSVSVRGKKVEIKNPKDAINNKIALITEDRKETGLILSSSVLDNIALTALKSMSHFGVIKRQKMIDSANKYVKELKVKTPNIQTDVSNLSGGNQQKVVLGKWLETDPDIIIMDDPTRGIDIGAKRDIYYLIKELALAGKGVILISSEMPELIGLCDRIAVFAAGRHTGTLSGKEMTQENIMQLASKFGD